MTITNLNVSEAPCNGEADAQTVVEFDTSTNSVSFHAQRSTMSGPSIFVQIDSSSVRVSGPALRAIRDAIDTLPPEAFADPAPVWVTGDMIRIIEGSSDNGYYVRERDGRWARKGEDSLPKWRGATDDEINEWLSWPTPCYAVMRAEGVWR